MNILTAKLGKMCISKHQIFISTLDSQHSIQLYTLYIIYVSQDDYINISSKKVNKQTTGDDRERKRLKNSSKDNKYLLVPDSSFLSDNHLIEKLRGYL